MKAPSWLPATTVTRIQSASTALEKRLGVKLVSVLLVGAAMTPSREDRALQPELIAVVEPSALDAIDELVEAIRPAMKARVRVRVVTLDELQRSADVLTVEIADWKERHLLVAGRDPFNDITWTKAQLRHGLEFELRALERRIRNRVLTGLASDGDRDDPDRALRDGINSLLLCAHLALSLENPAPPRTESTILKELSEKLSTDTSQLATIVSRLREGQQVDSVPRSFSQLSSLVSATVRWIDAMEVVS